MLENLRYKFWFLVYSFGFKLCDLALRRNARLSAIAKLAQVIAAVRTAEQQEYHEVVAENFDLDEKDLN
jgi:hypothetical protein